MEMHYNSQQLKATLKQTFKILLLS